MSSKRAPRPGPSEAELSETARIAEAARAAIESHRSITRESIGRRIKAALRGQNIAAVARKLGVSRQAIYDWCAGKFMPDVERMDLVAASTNVSLTWLISGRGAMRHSENHPGGYVVVGSPNVLPPPLAVQEEWLTQIYPLLTEDDDLELIAATDDAMEPTIKKSDLLIFRRLAPNSTTGNDGLYALVVASPQSSREEIPLSRWIVRRVLWGFDGSITIRPDNPVYQSETRTLRPEKAPLIQGPVLWRAGRL